MCVSICFINDYYYSVTVMLTTSVRAVLGLGFLSLHGADLKVHIYGTGVRTNKPVFSETQLQG